MKCFLLSLLLFFSPLASESVSFEKKVRLTCKQEPSRPYVFEEKILFDCDFFLNENSPHLVITLKDIQGSLVHLDQEAHLNSETSFKNSFELSSLKRLLNKPITLFLNGKHSLKNPIKDLDLHYEMLDHPQVKLSEIFFDQLAKALLSPYFYQTDKKLLTVDLYFPFQSSLALSPNLSHSSDQVELFFDEDISFTGPKNSPFEGIHYLGDLTGEIKWDENNSFCTLYLISHSLEKKETHDTPTTFEYTTTIKQLPKD